MINERHMQPLLNPTGHNMTIMAERFGHIINKIRVNEIKTILDIGSMDGWETINLSRIFHDADVHCFEPVPSNNQICSDHIQQYVDPEDQHKVHLHRIALNNQTGPMTFYAINEWEAAKRGKINRGMGSKYELMDPDMWPWEHNKQMPITVMGYTVSDWAKENNIDRIDGIWMDVQGAELDVLQGISDDLFNKLQFIMTEAGLKPYYHGQSLKSQMDEFLKSKGFVEWLPAQQVAHEYEANVIYLNAAMCNF